MADRKDESPPGTGLLTWADLRALEEGCEEVVLHRLAVRHRRERLAIVAMVVFHLGVAIWTWENSDSPRSILPGLVASLFVLIAVGWVFILRRRSREFSELRGLISERVENVKRD